MVLADPGQQLETRVLLLVQDQVQQHRGDALVLEQVARLGSRGGNRWTVTEVVQVDPQLLQHRGLVLDHEHGGAEDVGRTVDLETRRERRQADLALGRIAISGVSPANSVIFQATTYFIFY